MLDMVPDDTGSRSADQLLLSVSSNVGVRFAALAGSFYLQRRIHSVPAHYADAIINTLYELGEFITGCTDISQAEVMVGK